jgi:hypothetical protein
MQTWERNPVPPEESSIEDLPGGKGITWLHKASLCEIEKWWEISLTVMRGLSSSQSHTFSGDARLSPG